MATSSESKNLTGGSKNYVIADYIKFIFFCVLLLVPVYAIAKSAIKHDWVMMVIDALLVPVGFIHGLLMLFGFVD